MVKVVDDPKIKKLVKDLSEQGLSIAEIVEETGLARSTVNRIRRAANVPTITEIFKKKYKNLNKLIKEKNKGFEFFERSELREQVGLPKKEAPSDKKYKTLKLETPNQKHIKAFRFLTSNINTPASELTDLTSKVAALTKTSRNEASTNLSKFSEYIEFKPIANKLNNPAFKSRIGDKTLKDVMEITENVSLGGTSKLAQGNTPENFIINSALRHVEKGGDKIEFIKKPGSLDKNGNLITVTDAEFNYKGKKYSYDDLTLKGRKNPVFKEVYKSFDDLNDLLGRETINPITKEKVSFRNLMTEAYAKGAGYSYSKSPYDIDHFKSVKNEPFTNLRIIPRRINTSVGVLDEKGIQAAAGVLKEDTAKQYSPEFIEKAKKKTGYNYTKNITQLFNDEVKLANDILTEGRELRTPINIAKELYKNAPKGAPIKKYLEKNIAHCADGCFIKVANKNPERIAKKLSEDPKLIRLFRGESFPQRNIKSMKDTAKQFGTTLDEIKKDTLSGQWFTPNQRHASAYLAKPGRMKYVDVTPAELESFNKYKERVNKRPVKYSAMKVEGLPNPPTHGVTTSEFHQIIPKYKLKQMEDAGRLKTKYNLNPFTKRYVSAGDSELIKSTAGVLEYDDVLGGFVDSANPSEIVGQNQIKAWAEDNPMPVKAGTSVKPGMLRKTGRALAHLGFPLPTAALDSYFIGRQIEEGRDATEIAKDPFNWLGLATMDPLTKAAGMADKSGKLASVMRLGMSPGIIRGATRFLGLPGLALSTGLTAYDQYKKYQNKEGFVYDLFNKEEIDNTSV